MLSKYLRVKKNTFARLRSSLPSVGSISAVLAGLLVVLLYWHIVTPTPDSWVVKGKQGDYYNLLLNGFEKGGLNMDVQPRRDLLEAENPYDPRKRPPNSALHDASLYDGKYYLYFGPAPAVVLMWPFRLLVGSDMPLPLAMWSFASIGFLFSVLVLLRVRKDYAPRSGAWLVFFLVGGVGLAGLIPVLLRRTAFWEMAISGAYCFISIALYFSYRSIHERGERTLWLALASLAFGLAVASRATFVVALPFLFVPLFVEWLDGGREALHRSMRLIKCAVLGLSPVFAIGCVLMWYNYARFGSVTEFGQNYQLTSLGYEKEVQHFGMQFFWINAYAYFLAPVEWSIFLPYVNSPLGDAYWPVPLPHGYGGMELVFGFLRFVPLVWFLPLVAIVLVARNIFSGLLAWIAGVLIVVTGILLMLLFYFAANGRYLADFVPWLILLSCVGVAVSYDRYIVSRKPWVRGMVLALVSVVTVFSAINSYSYSLGMFNIYQNYAPRKFAKEVELSERMVPVFPSIKGESGSMLKMRIHLPRNIQDIADPLLVSGGGRAVDRYLIKRCDNAKVQVGVHTQSTDAWSEPFPLSATTGHDLAISWDRLPGRAGAQSEGSVMGVVSIAVDGVSRLRTVCRFVLPQKPQLFLGHDPFYGATRKYFGGKIDDAFFSEAAFSEASCRIASVAVLFPVQKPAVSERLIAIKTTECEYSICVEYRGGGGVVFVQDSQGQRLCEGGIPDLKTSRKLDCFLDGSDQTTFSSFSLLIDDIPLLGARLVGGVVREGVPFEFAGFSGGADHEGFSGIVEGWVGSINMPKYMRLERGAVEMVVVLPEVPEAAKEPLLVSGTSRVGEILYIEYLSNGLVRFHHDYIGTPEIVSEALALPKGVPIKLHLNLIEGNGGFSISYEGRVLWRAQHGRAIGDVLQLSFGRNLVGGLLCSRTFSGRIISVRYDD